MDERLLTLQLFLSELDIPSAIDTIDDRKRVQKAVYLGQLTGVNLSYRFGWYLMGPYSPALTKDYYELAEQLEENGGRTDNRSLHPSARAKLRRILPLLNPPEQVDLSPEGWLELVASYHYLRSVRRLSNHEARSVLQAQKPKLAGFVSQAASQLEALDLLPKT